MPSAPTGRTCWRISDLHEVRISGRPPKRAGSPGNRLLAIAYPARSLEMIRWIISSTITQGAMVHRS
jgi:hypothetical protein